MLQSKQVQGISHSFLLGRLKDVKMLEGCIVPTSICQLIKKKKSFFTQKNNYSSSSQLYQICWGYYQNKGPDGTHSSLLVSIQSLFRKYFMLINHKLWIGRFSHFKIHFECFVSLCIKLTVTLTLSFHYSPFVSCCYNKHIKQDHLWTIRQHFSPYTGGDMFH